MKFYEQDENERSTVPFAGRDVAVFRDSMDETGRLARDLAEKAIAHVLGEIDAERHAARIAEYSAILARGEAAASDNGGVIPVAVFRDILAAALAGEI